MQISLFDIIAGIINFFVLLFILNKLFYKPVREVMEKRQQNIEENINNAERKNNEASELISTYEKKLSEIDHKKTEIMMETKKEAEAYRNSLIEKYEAEAEGKREVFLSEVKEEKDTMASEIRELMAKGTVDIARNLFDQIGHEALEQLLFEELIKRIGTFIKENRDKSSVRDEGRTMLVYAKEPDEKKKLQLAEILNRSHIQTELDYREDTSLVAGYALQIEDYTIHASISHYLEKKEQQMADYFLEAVRDRSEENDTQK